MGRKKKRRAQKLFWDSVYDIVVGKHEIQGIQAANKLTSGYLLAVCRDGVWKEESEDSLIFWMKVSQLDAGLMELKNNSGYFFEHDSGILRNSKISAMTQDARPFLTYQVMLALVYEFCMNTNTILKM